jgi:ABC-type lipoprotein release transport system permease subunit
MKGDMTPRMMLLIMLLILLILAVAIYYLIANEIVIKILVGG